MNALPLGVCTRYGILGASSRLRYFQFREAFEAVGFVPRFHPFFPDSYLKRLYAGKGKSRSLAAAALLRRLAGTPFLPQRLLIEYELLPELSFGIESCFLRGKRYMLNFDDDVWLKYRGRPALEGKYDRLIAGASGVICANDLLLERVEKLNPNTVKIPTAVDLDAYPVETEKFPRFTVAWIGTPVTYRYLELHAEALRRMAQVAEFDLLVLAKKSLETRALPGVSMRFEEWSAESEAALLSRCHIGIMPLPADDVFAAGKSAFKLIQYLAAGLPAIASPVGENRQVLLAEETGFFASTPDEWAAALLRLREEPVRGRMAAKARGLAFDFSTRKYGPVYADFLKQTLA